MFDFNDEDEERKRAEWYAPLGEFMLLFSNLEFTCNEWITLLCNSKAMSNHIKGLWSFKKRVDLIIELISEYQVTEAKRELWVSLWKSINSNITLRNTIAHNPPFDNFGIEFDSSLASKDVTRAVEIHQLSKPLGDPGSGITLEKLVSCNVELRKILIQLDYESSCEAARY
ncbi:hypothetical protein [uncultured Porticoccus sp.]|uniref:hypothetical protein n=1 Tax=uncultured Porticoccus sp. TaxID=1256050 RepID=UPI00261F1E31|nr:hypothetical protein [uncultured Porticoccus sp.]